ncbi:MAG: cytidine deaminase [Bacilli bacterium]|jgi:cytidine deaminase|nr:cytidine deaminase [Bacilli bacterium]MDD2681675.1 cytidine deaminase [Bacilli bacterium]MDD3121476.1 cytidine deaminase [Bacilli bacterium]MDD4063521.1 cytidine deaminase [Bacilli bacterium]MDD4482015.1 cytidine deaminase [Bacilli bacterium]
MEKLYEEARKAFMNSYSPYSKFKVGAAIELKNGEIISGTNVENSSYGLSICAERSALFTAYSLGYRKNDIKKMLVIGDTIKPISPCGACRQVMSELLELDTEVILTNLNNERLIYKVNELLPYHFNEGDLNG